MSSFRQTKKMFPPCHPFNNHQSTLSHISIHPSIILLTERHPPSLQNHAAILRGARCLHLRAEELRASLFNFPKRKRGISHTHTQKKKNSTRGQQVRCSRALQQKWRRFMEPTKECKCCLRWWWVAFEAEGDKRTERLHSTWWWGPPDPQASSSLMTVRGRIAPPCNRGSLWHECFPCAKITGI